MEKSDYVVGLIVVALVALFVWALTTDHKDRQQCEELGGVILDSRCVELKVLKKF